MKDLYLYITSFFLLLAVGCSSLTRDHLQGEKEQFEMEDSLEELNESKLFHDLLFGLENTNQSGGILLLPEWQLMINGNYKSSSVSPHQAVTKYILFCNLKICV